MKKKAAIFLILVLFVKASFANDSLTNNKIEKLNYKVDSLSVLFNNEVSLNKKYIDIVDRTNNNLNMSWTPTSVIISIVGIFCAVFSILTFIMAFGSRQEVSKLLKHKSKDFDKKIADRIIELNEMVNDKLKEDTDNVFLTDVDTKLVDVINLIKKHN
ncbi:MAG: hypothetical protein IPN15_00755 [Saprospiraceae bacterium]|nr:hypothetical protein [Candidatus Vicinibacter affinis]